MRELNLLLTHILQISIEASMLVILILAAQTMLRKWLAPRWRYAMWGLLLIRLAMPILPQSRWSALNLFQQKTASNTLRRTAPQSPIVTYGIISDAPVAQPTEPKIVSIITPSKSTFTLMDAIAIAWAGGFFLLAARLAMGGIRLRRELADQDSPATPMLMAQLEECCKELGITRRPRLSGSSSISSPALCGIFRPTLILPVDAIGNLNPQELRFILLHELIHLKRWDVLAGSIFWVFNAIHWFNPLLWFAASRFRADREIACDAAVLALTHPQDRPAYGQTILKLLEMVTASTQWRAPVLAAAMAQNRSNLKRRFAAIAQPYPTGRGGSLIALTAILILGLLTLTRAQQAPATQHDTAGTIVRVYDVRDLIVSHEDFLYPPPNFNVGFPTSNKGTLIANNPTTKPSLTRDQLVAKFITDLERIVALESWKDNGGSVGSIRALPGTAQLIIAQTPENHELIRAVFDSWREKNAVQVTVESRFLGNAGDLPKPPGKWVEENGLRRWSEFLSDEQAAELLKTAQSNQQTTTLTAPRLTLFDHQRAFVVVSAQTAYVASVTPTKLNDGSTAFDPHMKNVESGIMHDCRATVSDDRQSVKLELHSRLNRLVSLESIAAPESDPKQPAFYQVPHVSSTRIEGTIDVPDGKTVLLQIIPQLEPPANGNAGQDVSMAKLPFLKSVTGEEPLLVLVKPTVILQREKEQEQEQFPQVGH